MAVKKTIILNGLGQMGNRLVRIAEQLLLVPFFLAVWGAAYYGEWLTISIIPSVLAFSDLGFGTAVSNSFVIAYSADEKKKAADYYITGLIIITLTVLLGVLLSIIAIYGAWKMDILEKSVISPAEIMISLAFLMASRLTSFYMQLFEGFFRAKHKAAMAFNLYTVEGILRIVVGIITLLIGCNIVGFAFGQCAVAILFNLFFAISAVRIIRDLPRGTFNREIAIITVKKGLGFMLTPVWQSIYMQGSTFVVRIVLGPTAVAVFNTIRTVCKSINAAFSVVNGAIFPEVQIAYGKGDMMLAKRIYIIAMQSVFCISMLGLVFLLVFGQDLYSWWTKNTLEVNKMIWYVFMLGIPLNALWWTAGTVFRAINKPTRFSIYGFIAATLSALISWGLAYPLGLMGAAIGFVAMDLIMLLLTIPLSNKEIGVRFMDLFKINYGNLSVFRRK